MNEGEGVFKRLPFFAAIIPQIQRKKLLQICADFPMGRVEKHHQR